MIHVVNRTMPTVGTLLAVCASAGGIPKQPLTSARVTAAGLVGDGHAHTKHNRPDRAVSLFDIETLEQLRKEGFPLFPGAIGENLTVQGLQVQRLQPGVVLRIGDVRLRLELPRKPCYVLDDISPSLQEVIVGRCGYMASVMTGGLIEPGMQIQITDDSQS